VTGKTLNATSNYSERILVWIPQEHTDPSIQQTLVAAGRKVDVCAGIESFRAGVQSGAGAGVIAEEALEPDALQMLIGTIERQPAWSNFPLVVLASRGKGSAWSNPAVQSLVARGNIRVLEPPFDEQRLLGVVRAALRARKQQYAIRDALAELEASRSALRRRNEAFGAMAEALPDILFTATADGVWDYVNKCFERYTGMSVAAALGSGWTQSLHPDDRTWILQQWREGTERTEPFDLECRLCLGTGCCRWFLGRLQPIHDDAGELVKWFGTFTDITRHKQLEEQLRELNENLEQRVAERTAIAERRTRQLQAMSAELAQTEERERRRLAEFLHDHLQQLLYAARLGVFRVRRYDVSGDVDRGLKHIDELLNQSISASRSLTSELSPPALYDSGLAVALRWLARQMEEKHGLRVVLDAPDEIDPIDENTRVFLFQAVRELLFNVVKHAQVDEAQVTVVNDKGHIRIRVVDEGAGFTPAQLDDHDDSITGFGLLSLRERVEVIGGRLEITSAPGGGSVLELEVVARGGPADSAQHQEDQDAVAEEATAQPAEVLRVLLADDHELLREGLASLLEDEPDIELVGEAIDGQHAVELVEQLLPDVVLMDITMPRLNGIEATRQITRMFPKIRVIGLSMHDDEDMAVRMYESGAAAYLPKGDSSDSLIATIRGQNGNDA